MVGENGEARCECHRVSEALVLVPRTTAASALGISLEEVAAANVAKLRRRYPEGYSDEASVDRDKS